MRQKRSIPLLLAGLGAALGATAISTPPPAVISNSAAPAQGAQIQAAHGTQPAPVRQAPAPSQPLRLSAMPHFPGAGFYPIRERGMTPKEWGMSRACARMVRHNKMRAIGIGGARI